MKKDVDAAIIWASAWMSLNAPDLTPKFIEYMQQWQRERPDKKFKGGPIIISAKQKGPR